MTSSEAKGLPPSLLGGGNLATSLAFAAERWPERVALTHEEGAVNLAQLEARSACIAAMLRTRGVERGDRVALQLPNVPAFVYLYFAVLRLGAVVVPMNPLLKGEESAYNLEDSEARLLFSWHESDAPAGSGGGVKRVVVTGPAGEELTAGFEPQGEIVDVDPEETAVILYTSGTTGRPKGAELTHRNLGLNTRAVISNLEIVAEDVLMGMLPLYHSFGQTCTLNATVAVGARLALLARFDPERALELMARERVTVLMGVPTMLFGIAAAAEDPAPFAALRVCMSGGAPLPLEQGRAFAAVAGVPVIESYGLSETSPAATLHRPDANRVGSVGRAIEGVEVRIFDEEMRELPAGETGQIAIRGHNVMKGYWRHPDATAEAITDDGWFLSGDLGRIDDDGYVYVVGRLKDMILRGGLNVYPREVEDVLYSHPSVVEAAVVGVPDERLGEEVGAAVVLAPDAATAPSELRSWLRERVAPYKYPRLIWTLDELPKGPTGKILKRAISPPDGKVPA